MSKVPSLKELQSQIRRAERELTRQETLRDQALETLRKDFNCEEIEDAENLLAELEAEFESLEEKVKSNYARFRKRYEDVLGDDDADPED